MKPYYEQDGITIYHGDCREVLPTLGRFDLLLTDPPYGINITASPRLHETRPLAPSDWDHPIAIEVLEMAIQAAERAIIWGGNYYQLPPSACWLTWDKCQPEELSFSMAEHAWTNLDGTAKLFRKAIRSSEGSEHPTAKPESLMQWCIRRAAAQTVLDPFLGSGTTLVAAKRLGKTGVGVEREERYCEIAAKRLSQGVLSGMFG